MTALAGCEPSFHLHPRNAACRVVLGSENGTFTPFTRDRDHRLSIPPSLPSFSFLLPLLNLLNHARAPILSLLALSRAARHGQSIRPPVRPRPPRPFSSVTAVTRSNHRYWKSESDRQCCQIPRPPARPSGFCQSRERSVLKSRRIAMMQASLSSRSKRHDNLLQSPSFPRR